MLLVSFNVKNKKIVTLLKLVFHKVSQKVDSAALPMHAQKGYFSISKCYVKTHWLTGTRASIVSTFIR